MDVAHRLLDLTEHYGLPAVAAEQLSRLLALTESSPISLTAVRDPERGVDVHIADSLTGLLVPALKKASSIADIGSGAGFPGLVLAVALPSTSFTLVESVGKKAAFLLDAAAELGLSNVEVADVRVEDWSGGLADQEAVTARALAPLNVLVEYAAPLLTLGGSLVAWKGPAAVAELGDAAAAAARLGMTTPQALRPGEPLGGVATEGSERSLYVSCKVSETPPGFPRRAGMARKRPIGA